MDAVPPAKPGPADLAREFAAAFNRGSTADMAALLHEDATALVIGSGFPMERGREQIATTSFPHVLDPAAALHAEVRDSTSGPLVILVTRKGELDTAVELTADGGAIRHVAYTVVHFQERRLSEIARSLGLPVAPRDDSGIGPDGAVDGLTGDDSEEDDDTTPRGPDPLADILRPRFDPIFGTNPPAFGFERGGEPSARPDRTPGTWRSKVGCIALLAVVIGGIIAVFVHLTAQ